MTDLSDAARLALGRYWPEIYGGANNHLTTTDLFTNIRQRAIDLGLPSVGVSASTISTLRGIAGGIISAADRLNSALTTDPITSSLISEPPWSRSAQEQAAMPVYHVGFDHTIQDDEGNTLVARQTIVITGALPSTVGELQDLVASEAQLLASQSPGTSKKSPHGTSISVDNLSLMVV